MGGNCPRPVCQYPIYFFTSPSGIQLIISASPNVEITSPGLVDFLTPVIPARFSFHNEKDSGKSEVYYRHEIKTIFKWLRTG
jgi:hypothetical protein